MQFCKVDTYIKMIHNPFRKWNFRVNWINFKSHFLKLDTKKIVELIFHTFWPWENLARSYKFENCSCCDLCSNTSSFPWSTCLVHRTSSNSWRVLKVSKKSLNVSESFWKSLKFSESLRKSLESLWKSFNESHGHALETCFESRFLQFFFRIFMRLFCGIFVKNGQRYKIQSHFTLLTNKKCDKGLQASYTARSVCFW